MKNSRTLLLLVPLLVAVIARSNAATITWTNPASGLWNTPANWDLNRVPSASDTAVITVAGTGGETVAVTLDVSPTVGGLILGATGDCGGGQALLLNGQTLTLNGPAVVNGCGQFTVDSGILAGSTNATISGIVGWTGGSLSGSLTLATNCTLSIAGGNDHNMADCVVTNYGTVAWSGGRVRGGGGSGTRVYNFGLWDAQSDQVFNNDYDGASVTFSNAGTFRKSGSTNTTALTSGVSFVNTGAVEVERGTLAFAGGGSFTGGSVSSPGGVVQLATGTFTINGTMTSGNVELVGGTLAGANIIQGALNWVAGDWNGAAGVSIATNSVLTITSGNDHNMADCLVTNYGTVAWSGGRVRGGGNNGTQVHNFGLWDAQSDQVFNNDYDGANVVFSNAGTFRKSASTNTTALTSGVGFVNTGAVEVERGTLTLNGGGSFSGGSITNGAGVVELAAGAFTINGTITSTNVQLVGGTLAGSNVIRGALNWVIGDWNGAAGVTIATNSLLNIVSANDHNMADCVVINYGTVALSGGRVRGGGGNTGTQVYNFGLWDAQSDQVFNDDYNGKNVIFNNAGTVRSSPGANTSSLLNGVAFSNTGMVDVESGTLAFAGGGSFTGGSVSSPGGVVQLATGTFTINGTMTSGNVELVGGTLAGANIIQGALNWVAGDWNGAASVTIATNSVLNITSGNDHNMADCLVTNYGTVAWSGGRVRGGGNNGTEVHNFGLWDAQSDQVFNNDYDGANVAFSNAGTFRKSASTNTTALTSGAGFVNTGAVEVERGTLTLNGGGSFDGGSITNGAGVVELAAGAFTINGTITSTNVELVGGTLAGSNVIRGAVNWVVGDWNGAAGVTIATNSLLNIVSANDHNMADCVVINYGTVAWSGGRVRGGGGNTGTQVYNFGLWDAQSDQVFNNDFDGKNVLLSNAGTLRKSASTNTTALTSGVGFVNTGAVEVERGTLTLNGGGSFDGGSITNGAGVVELAAGAFTINGTITSTNVELVGGTLAGSNVIRGAVNWVVGDWNGAAGVTIATNSLLNIVSGNDHNMADCVVTNFGTVAWSGGRVRGGGGNTGTQVYNFGLWDAQGDQTFNNDYDGASVLFSNAGTFRKSAGGANPTALTSGVAFSNVGTVDAQTGALSFNGGYAQTGGTLSFGIGSLTDFGRISISGNAPLTGVLHIDLKNAFQPSLSNSLPVMTYSASTGAFGAVTGCSIGHELFFDVVDEGTRLLLVVKDGTPHLDSVRASLANGQFLFRLTTGTDGQTYLIEASTTLTNWIPISTNTLANCVLDFVDPNALNFPYRFYRATLVP